MKRLLAQIILIVVATILLPSCSKQLNMSLTKRHYRSGYYVDFDIKHHIHTIQLISRPSHKVEPPISTLGTTKSENMIVTDTSAGFSEKTGIVFKNVYHQKKKIAYNKPIEPISANETSPVLSTAPANILNNKAESEHHVQVNVNVSFAVIVICAIFIPPLGVGLMYGINDYFWIDLILTLLFFFPGMIFALVVVLM